MDPEFMEDEHDNDYLIDEPVADFDIKNANDVEFETENNETMMPTSTVVESTKIDLESIVRSYTSYALINRLLFIAEVCPPLRFEAFKLLIDYIMKETQNVSMLILVYQKIDKYKALGETKGIEVILPIDYNWVENVASKSQANLEFLLAEFKRQKDEAVKESIRRSMEEVFHHHVQMGNLQEALKLYNRGMREYCTTPKYVLQMLIRWINVTIYLNQWPRLTLLLPQAERAINEVIDRENIQSTSTSRSTSNFFSSSNTAPSKNYKELVLSSKAKIAAVDGLAKMKDKQYKQAAEKFMTVDIDALDYPQLLSASDVAIYGTLCALATFSRTELKEKVLGSTLFRKFLESEPKLVELLQKFCRSEFGICLDILNELQDQLLLNMFLAQHIQELYMLIRRSSIIQYFHPYLSVNIFHVAEVFRTKPDDMERELFDLIEKGLLKARIDSYGKVLYAKFSDNRVEIYKRVLTLQKRLFERVYGILIRAALQNHKIGYNNNNIHEKTIRRRRGNHGLHINDSGMESELHFDQTTSNATTSNTNRIISGVQRIFNAAASRIHSNNSNNRDLSGSDSISSSLINGSAHNKAFNYGMESGELIPAPPENSPSITTPTSGIEKNDFNSEMSIKRGVSNTDMELDDDDEED